VQSPPYPEPPRRPVKPTAVLWVGAGALALLVVAAIIVVLTTSGNSSGGRLKGSLQIRKVLGMTNTPCPPGDTTRLTSVDSAACYQLGDGMTVTTVKRLEVRPPDPARGSTDFTVQLTLVPADAARFGTLTGQVVGQQEPRNQIAIVVNGKVVSAPVVREPITGGDIVIEGGFDRPKAQRYVDLIRG
jgi:hypothetical protein